jgi:hypothetical protein
LSRLREVAPEQSVQPSGEHDADPWGGSQAAQAWLALARQLVEKTTDVGKDFAEEARKIHYGEREERAIRGTATPQEKQSLADEGIEVMSFPLPQALKGQLQ